MKDLSAPYPFLYGQSPNGLWVLHSGQCIYITVMLWEQTAWLPLINKSNKASLYS